VKKEKRYREKVKKEIGRTFFQAGFHAGALLQNPRGRYEMGAKGRVFLGRAKKKPNGIELRRFRDGFYPKEKPGRGRPPPPPSPAV